MSETAESTMKRAKATYGDSIYIKPYKELTQEFGEEAFPTQLYSTEVELIAKVYGNRSTGQFWELTESLCYKNHDLRDLKDHEYYDIMLTMRKTFLYDF